MNVKFGNFRSIEKFLFKIHIHTCKKWGGDISRLDLIYDTMSTYGHEEKGYILKSNKEILERMEELVNSLANEAIYDENDDILFESVNERREILLAYLEILSYRLK